MEEILIFRNNCEKNNKKGSENFKNWSNMATHLRFERRNGNPLKNFHSRFSNRDPFLFPEKLKSQTELTSDCTPHKKNEKTIRLIKNKCFHYQCLTLSTTCITLLISSLARLRVSARTDRDIMVLVFSKIQHTRKFVYIIIK